MILVYITIFLFAGYSALIIYYWLSWKRIPEFIAAKKTDSIAVSVIIAARNEEQNISKLLHALAGQTYPRNLWEVIVADDNSTDDTVRIAKQFPGTVILELKHEEQNSYKKNALDRGINAAAGNVIVTTDADCVPPAGWLETMTAFKDQNNSVFIAAPVIFENNGSVLETFQALDFLILQGITGASVHRQAHSMCNGANLAYEKKAFFEVNGFENIDNIASGDDMLLMHKIWEKFPGRVHYLKSKNAIVATQPMKTWKEFLNQRIRWASKARYYQDKRILLALLLVYFFNLSCIALLFAAIWDLKFVIWFLLFWVAKTMIEFPFVYSVAKFFNKQSLLKFFFIYQPLHMAYTIVAGLFGQFGTYEWKGRKVK
jgi:cellulose synthase/poly-beta-1,6-N-acetylglucosamine synthase-like glycosyltransferase